MLQALRTARAEQGLSDRALSQSSRLLILLFLADAANKGGVCWPSQPAIARLTRLSVRTISAGLDDLMRDGHISIDTRPGRNDVFTVHPGKHCRGTPATISGVKPKAAPPLQPLQHPLQPLPDTPATVADESSNEPKNKNHAGTRPSDPDGSHVPASEIEGSNDRLCRAVDMAELIARLGGGAHG